MTWCGEVTDGSIGSSDRLYCLTLFMKYALLLLLLLLLHKWATTLASWKWERERARHRERERAKSPDKRAGNSKKKYLYIYEERENECVFLRVCFLWMYVLNMWICVCVCDLREENQWMITRPSCNGKLGKLLPYRIASHPSQCTSTWIIIISFSVLWQRKELFIYHHY